MTQKSTGGDTTIIERVAPKTWAYLNQYGKLLDSRKSSIYQRRPRFSIFGIGSYSFASWKVAISGLYKKLHFSVIGPYNGKPVMVDDTCYFIPCQCREQAESFLHLLNSKMATDFLNCLIFWDNKRPTTVDVLRRLDFFALSGLSATQQLRLMEEPPKRW